MFSEKTIWTLKPWNSFFFVVQLLSHIWLFATPWTAARHPSLSITNSWSLLKLMSTESVMPSNHLNLCCPLLLLPSILPSIRVFSNESVLRIRWPKYWSFSFSISPSNNIQDWLLLGLTGLISLQSKGLSRVFSSTAVWKHQFLQRSAFFMVQLSHRYMTTGKTIASTIQTFVDKVKPLLFNMLFRFVTAFLPRSKRLWISWLVTICSDFGGQENKVYHCFPLFLHLFAMKWWNQMPFVFWMLSCKSTFSLSSFTFIKRLFSSSSLSAVRVVSSVYLRLLLSRLAIFFFFYLAILTTACASSSLAFFIMCSALR